MKSDIDLHNALASVGEVAVFAWSLLELLLTRVLPLLGFIAGHLLLHCCHLLVAPFTPSPSVTSRHRESIYSRAVEYQHLQGGYGDVKLPKTTATDLFQEHPQQLAAIAPPTEDHHLQSPHSQPSDEQTVHLHPSAPAPSTADQIPIPEADITPVDHVAYSASSDSRAAVDEKVEQGPDLVKIEHLQLSDPPNIAELVQVAKPHLDASDSSANCEKVVPVDASDSSAECEKVVPVEATNNSGSMKRRPFTRVLPPSLSQIKHTFMQKSRRAFSLSKKESPRVRKVASTNMKSVLG